MRRGLLLTLAAIAAIAAGATGVAAAPSTLPYNTIFALSGSVSPSKLPRDRFIPVTARFVGKIGTTDGTHPPALRELAVDIDKDVKINAKGFPVCKAGGRDVRHPQTAREVCSDAILGEGEAETEIAFPERSPIKAHGRLLVVNGGEKDGKVTLLIQTFITVPRPTEIVTTVTIQRKGTGLDAIAEIPVIAGGSGSALNFDFRLGKTYTLEGKRIGYLEARCPDRAFDVTVPKAVFKNEAHEPGAQVTTVLKGSLAVPCTPRG